MIRAAQTGDLEAVRGLYRQLHPQDPVLPDGADAAVFAEIVEDPRLHLMVLDVEGVVVATAYLNVIPNMTRSAAPYAVIENVVVDESRRGTGLGRLLMAGTLEAAWAAGCY